MVDINVFILYVLDTFTFNERDNAFAGSYFGL